MEWVFFWSINFVIAKNEAICNSDVTDELSYVDREELINLVSDPFGKDTISQKELDKALRQWRTK